MPLKPLPRLLCALAVAALAACDPEPILPGDSGAPTARDASAQDAGVQPADAADPGADAGLPDAEVVADAGLADAAEPGPDADLPDAETADAAPAPEPDAGPADAGATDAAPPGSDAQSPDADAPDAAAEPGPDAEIPDAAADLGDAGAGEDAGEPSDGGALATAVRVMAANLTTGNYQSYDPGEGLRLIQGVHPDVVLIQEFRYGDNEAATMQAMLDSTLGAGFSWCREYSTPPPAGTIPNGIISRWPILECGSWDDPEVFGSREFAYAHIDLPGAHDLWAVSLHLLTKDEPTRNDEAVSLVAYLKTRIPAGDLVVIGGDFNTIDFTEDCYVTLSAAVDVAAPHPADQNGNVYTNLKRTKPYDHVFANPALRALQVPTYIGASLYPDGLVLDSRVYTPLSEISPVLESDSDGAVNGMQHMGVVKDFLVPD